ncbi:MAG TPA: amidohydrolase family protein [Bryobacteraceae bacterium]|nr:amidohydrolase family protein [Bryobacteraceae bacterium]
MSNRREFIQSLAAGAILSARALAQARREVRVGGKRVKVVDVHAHATFPEVVDLVKGSPLERFTRNARAVGAERIAEMDKRGVDVQALSVNVYWWYQADRDLAAKIVETHDNGLAKLCAAHQGRFVALSSPAIQFPDLAASQLEHAMKQLGARGASVGGHVNGEPLSLPKYDPFWAKAQELGALVFMHPNNSEGLIKPETLQGAGDLPNVLGNPFETTLFLSHLIFDGTLDRFPSLKICGAHGGGYLPSYLGRIDVACDVRPNAKCANKKKPREYFHDQLLADSMVFSPEGIRHMVAEIGASQIVYGTDMPFVWPDTVDAILGADIPDAQKEAILGGNLAKLLRL